MLLVDNKSFPCQHAFNTTELRLRGYLVIFSSFAIVSDFVCQMLHRGHILGRTDTLCREYPCLNGKTTIRRKQFCDGVFDCPDFSDECLCNTRTDENEATFGICDQLLYQGLNECCVGYFQCEIQGYDSCIPGKWICDEIEHCTNGLDEANCPSSNRLNNKSLRTNGTSKANSTSSLVRMIDCDRASHHSHTIPNGCSVESTSKIHELDSGELSTFGDVKGLCIDWRRLYDGVADCSGGTDEWAPTDMYCFNRWKPFCAGKEDAGCSVNETTTSNGFQYSGRGLGNNCDHHLPRISSTSQYMFKVKAHSAFLGVLGIVTIIVNGVVAIHQAVSYCKRDRSEKRKNAASWSKDANSILVFNLTVLYSWSGLIMTANSIIAYTYSGSYWELASSWWRDKTICIFAMYVYTFILCVPLLIYAFLTGVRLYSILYPFQIVKLRYIYIILAICWILPTTWTTHEALTSFRMLASIPNLPQVNAIVLETDQVKEIVRRSWILYSISNGSFPIKTIALEDLDIESLMDLLKDFAPKFAQGWKTLGIFSSHSMCFPRPIARIGEPGWQIVFVTIIISMIIYMFITVAYVVIFTKLTNRKCSCCWKQTVTNLSRDETPRGPETAREREDRGLHTRIFWMIVINISAWFPVFLVNVIYNLAPHVEIRTAVINTMLSIFLSGEALLSPFFYSRFLREIFHTAFTRPLKNLLRNVGCYIKI